MSRNCIENRTMTTRNQSGSSLIEVIVAMLILALLIVGLNAGVVSLINSNINSKELNAATSAGFQLFEEFRRDDYTNMLATGSSVDTVRSRYIRDWRMTSDPAKTKIELFVRWPLTQSRHQITLSTIIARP